MTTTDPLASLDSQIAGMGEGAADLMTANLVMSATTLLLLVRTGVLGKDAVERCLRASMGIAAHDSRVLRSLLLRIIELLREPEPPMAAAREFRVIKGGSELDDLVAEGA